MYLLIKRFFDVVLSGILILILSPLLVPIIIGLRLTGEGYIFYKQERVGYRNKRFFILKFATMLKDSPNMAGGIMTSKKDPRITPMGGFLRKSKINELPQTFNIFLGDMSFVGPRPVMPISFETYPIEIQKIIYNVKPGLTGVGSIAFRDEEEILSEIRERGEDPWIFYRESIYPFKGELEKWYQSNYSFLVDFKILLLTAFTVIKPNNNLLNTWFKGLPKRSF